jgi:hypothetical protein
LAEPVADISRILKINLALLENARPNPRKLVRESAADPAARRKG